MRIPPAIARLLRPEVLVVSVCFLLPDLLDKPLWVFGIGCGRYVGHTLLFAFLVALAFSLRKRVYGLLALFGGMFHLLLDIGWFVPWFYPFVGYDFPDVEFADAFRWYQVVGLFLELAFALIILGLVMWLLSRFHERRARKTCPDGRSNEKRNGDGPASFQ